MTTKTENVLARISQKKLINTNVLIVVEKCISGKLLQHLLEKQNICITSICTSGHDALEKIKQKKPDLVLTDMSLRDCNGVYFSQQLNLQEDGLDFWIYFTEFASDLIVQQTMALANEFGCNISKYGSDGSRVNFNFESYYNQAKNFDKSNELIARIATQPIRVFLVDDQQIVLLGLEKLIESEKPKMEVVGKAMNIADAKLPVMEGQPDILIINICLTDIDSIDCVADFASNGNTRVIIFTDTNDNDLVDEAVLNGARGVLDRKESMQTILRAVQKVHDGELWLDRMTTARIFLQSSRIRGKIAIDADIDKPVALTRKECMILKAFSDGTGGEQNKQIAAKLCMSEHTLRNHLTSIFGKLGIKNRFSLFAYAKQHFQQLENTLAMEESVIREQ